MCVCVQMKSKNEYLINFFYYMFTVYFYNT